MSRHEKMQSHIGCICLTFLQCVFSMNFRSGFNAPRKTLLNQHLIFLSQFGFFFFKNCCKFFSSVCFKCASYQVSMHSVKLFWINIWIWIQMMSWLPFSLLLSQIGHALGSLFRKRRFLNLDQKFPRNPLVSVTAEWKHYSYYFFPTSFFDAH